MRGKRARLIRKEGMPQDLLNQMRQEIKPLAQQRQATIMKSNQQMKQEQGKAWQDHQNRAAAAEKEYAEAASKVVERYERAKEERNATSRQAASA